MATACSNEIVPGGIFQVRSENALTYSENAPRPLTESEQNKYSQSKKAYTWGSGIARVLTTSDGCADWISNLEIHFEVRPEFHDLSGQVASDVSAIRGEEPVG